VEEKQGAGRLERSEERKEGGFHGYFCRIDEKSCANLSFALFALVFRSVKEMRERIPTILGGLVLLGLVLIIIFTWPDCKYDLGRR